jgi:hypothetical protein
MRRPPPGCRRYLPRNVVSGGRVLVDPTHGWPEELGSSRRSVSMVYQTLARLNPSKDRAAACGGLEFADQPAKHTIARSPCWERIADPGR